MITGLLSLESSAVLSTVLPSTARRGIFAWPGLHELFTMLAQLLILLLVTPGWVTTSWEPDYYYDDILDWEDDIVIRDVAQQPNPPTDEPNVALNGTSSQSSTYDKLGSSANAIDGSFVTNYLKAACSHTDLDIEPWWMVDLKAIYRVSFVSVTNRGDCCSDRLNGAEVRIGNSAKDGGTRNRRCGKIPSLGQGATVNLNCSGLQGRYVTVTIPGRAAYLTLCQVQVFGVPGQENATDANKPGEDSQEQETNSTVMELKNVLKHSNAATNVALAGVAYQSSTLGRGVPEKANDGSLAKHNGSGQCAHTKREMEPWWTVDLLSRFKVFSVALTIPADIDNEQLAGAQIRVGDSASGRAKNPSCGSALMKAPGDTISLDCGEMLGRYVTIFIPGREDTLVLCEVQVFGVPEGTPSGDGNRNLGPAMTPHGASNLALKGLTSQSSNFKFYDESLKAVDGSLSSNYLAGFCTHTQQEFEPWWMVELKAPASIFSIAITNRGDCCRERINGAEIHVGNSRKEGGRHNPRCGVVFRMGYGETLSFTCNGMVGRYVSILIPDRKEYLTVCEVQVFGVLTSSPDEPMSTTAEPTSSPRNAVPIPEQAIFKIRSDPDTPAETPEEPDTPTETPQEPDTPEETPQEPDIPEETPQEPDTPEETPQKPDTPAETPQEPGLYGRSLVFPEESKNSYVILTPERRWALRAFTLCLRVSTSLPEGRDIILFSYRTKYFDALTLWREKDGRLGFYMNGPVQYFKMTQLGPAWTHLCLTWNSFQGRTHAYVNGQMSKGRYFMRGHRVTSGGIYMLGQDQDSLGGDFEASQSFVGEIRDLYMWDRILNKGVLKQVFRGKNIPEGTMFDWRSLSYEIRGNVIVKESDEAVSLEQE